MNVGSLSQMMGRAARAGMLALGASALAMSCAVAASAEGKVAGVFSGPITDKGFSQFAFEAMKDEAAKAGADFAYTDSVAPSSMVETLRGYARSGATLVIGVGEEFTPPALQVGEEFPDVDFAIVNSNRSNGVNVSSVLIDQWPLGYLAGVLAADGSATGTVGLVNGMEFESTKRLADGFASGARSVNPDAKVLNSLTGDFNDPAKGRAAATAMIAGGADVIVSALDLGAQGIVAAAKQAGDVHMIGFFVDQAAELKEPELFYTSAIANWPEAVREVVRRGTSGELGGQSYTFAVNEPTIAYLAPYGPAVTDEMKANVEAALAAFRAGEIEAP